jgi:hypothetical protein
MKLYQSALPLAALTIALAIPAGAQTSSTLSGKLVDFATYVTKDHNMDAMKGDHAMKGGDHAMAGGDHAMAGGDHAMAGGDHAMAGAPESCPALGLVSSSRKIVIVAAQQGSATAKELCAKVNADVTLTGVTYSQGGSSVFLVNSLK